MQSRVALGVVLLEEWRGEDWVVGVHGFKDVIARGSEEHADRGDSASGGHLEDATDEAHLVGERRGWRVTGGAVGARGGGGEEVSALRF